MYAVSDAYLEGIAGQSVQVNWHGTIRTTIGTTYHITPASMVEGSGKITREICPRSDIEIGTTCAAELDLSVYLENVDRYELYNAVAEIYFQLRLPSGSWETVPLGKFTLTDPPERSRDIITLHAYDNMLKFNRDFSANLIGSPYSMLTYACSACGVELGSTQAEIESYPNGKTETYTFQELAIYTYRDLVGYLAAYLCCYACIGVDGKLYLRPYSMDAVRDISPDWRFSYTPQDYEAFYTSLTAYFAVSQETEIITAGAGGLTYEMGANPLLQFNADEVRQGALSNILAELSEVTYTPFTATVPCDPSLMVGDVVSFSGNHAVDGKVSAITKQVIRINGSMDLTCAGSDPKTGVLTEKEKAIQAASRNANKDAIYYYDYANAEEITVGDGESARIILFNYITTKETHIDFHGEVKCRVDTSEVYDEDGDSYTEEDGVIYVTYRSGGTEILEYHPVDTFFDGTHLLHLLWTWWASANIYSTFEVFIRCEGCTVTIEQGASRGYIAGVGLVGDGAWDGIVRINDDVPRLSFRSILKEFTPSVEVSLTEPVGPELEQDMPRFSFGRILKGFTPEVTAYGLHRFSVAYDSSRMAYSNIVISGSAWVVDDKTASGTVTTPDCAVSGILWAESPHDGADVSYIVSFDGGTTWWTYAGGWAEPDYTQEVYGMVEGTLREITPEQWAEKLDGTIMVRAILQNDAKLYGIQIYLKEYE